jgi:hypothetical protein
MLSKCKQDINRTNRTFQEQPSNTSPVLWIKEEKT